MQKITKKYSKSQLIQIGFLLILFGIFLCGSQFFQKQKLKVFDKMGQTLYQVKKQKNENKKDDPKEELTKVPVTTPDASEVIKNDITVSQYIGILEIPKIGLKRGFVDPSSPHNNVEENITILKPVSMPNVKGGNFILAAHSGTGAIAYFDKLYQLEIHDKIYVEYQGNQYTYEIVNIYNQPKTGTIKIYRDKEKTTLTLITCTNNNDKKQTVYIANQI